MRPGKPVDQIPVFLLTGFLGAGKTTLLNRILENPSFQDTALIINEFGLVSVDHDLIREGRERPVVTTTGCICCTVGSDLRSSLDELLIGRRDDRLPPFSRVIVETTGLADPAPIINSLIPGGVAALSLRDHAVARAFRLSGAIAVVDVQGIGAALKSHSESLRQIAFADHAVLTRTDAAPAHGWPERLRTINPALRVHDAAAADFDPARLLAPGSYSAFGKGEGVEAWLMAETDHHHDHGADFHNLNRHGNVVAIPLMHDQPLELGALRRFLIKLTSTPGNGILRIKGLVALQDDPAAPAVVHAVQHRLYPVARLDAWPQGQASSRLVVIGTYLDEAAIRADFDTLAGKPQPFLASVLDAFKRGGA
ncbi:GTP-binding protein [Paracoccus denitrificans]|uniref:CobW family GTP-binding protein n=1 Tax=Paracoccus denitrificans TaxID=266 RepID=UPI001E4FC794|nr:GTP-binding protein [Paracoccus denitrificans]UFS64903.1 GTP-binding protein [Paracoccus denitrificans]